MAELITCPTCGEKFTYFKDIPVIVDKTLPDHIVRFKNSDGTYTDFDISEFLGGE